MSAIAVQESCELLHLAFKGRTLHLTLDRDGGITHEHCAAVAKSVSALLDVEDFGRDKYTLEVSSPGVERDLYGPRDYLRYRHQFGN